MGEGRVRVKCDDKARHYIPLPFVPSRQGRGKKTFYETIKQGIKENQDN